MFYFITVYKFNLLVYTGGCKRWNNNIIDNKNNQIYQITSNGMRRLVSNDGQKAMTDPATLSAYIKWCRANYPATRYGLILWDHGGGSVSGYGYDEKVGRNGGSMDLAGINKALKDGGFLAGCRGRGSGLLGRDGGIVAAR